MTNRRFNCNYTTQPKIKRLLIGSILVIYPKVKFNLYDKIIVYNRFIWYWRKWWIFCGQWR